ncbi:MAG: Clp protease N-terminal domain-containing protein [Nocardioidaceae bacterium]
MFERFTKRARAAVQQAWIRAAEAGSSEIDPEHLLLAIIDDEDTLAVQVMTKLGAPPKEVRAALSRRDLDGAEPDASDDLDAEALQAIGIDLDEVRRQVEENLGGSLHGGVRRSRPRFAAESKKVLGVSLREALSLRHNYIGTEHLLLGLVKEGPASLRGAFSELGLRHEGVRAAVADAVRQAG